MFGATDRIRIKICGITNAVDAIGAIEFGADALGFNLFTGSKRYIDISSAKEWIADLPTTASKIAVMVNPTFEQAMSVAELPFIDGLQLHGQESPEFCEQLSEQGTKFIKAVPVRDEHSIRAIPDFFTKTIMLDSVSGDSFGGQGRTFPWSVAREFVAAHPDLEVILAGGLNPENVGAAVREARPFGVDVASGVESFAGRKDLDRVRAFIEAARSS